MTNWIKACAGTPGCAEVSMSMDGTTIHLRSTEDPNAIVSLTRKEWEDFVAGVKAGDFDNLGAES